MPRAMTILALSALCVPSDAASADRGFVIRSGLLGGAVPINRNAQMSRRAAYKDYVIDIIRESNDSWKAKVTRMDGALIRLKYGDRTVSSITASARYSEEGTRRSQGHD
jgi:hypothetical protein